jgi:formylmethanofuran dehydrogenase subunit C
MIRLRLRARPPLRLALDELIPERLAGLGAPEIARLRLGGKREGVVGDWFEVAASGDQPDRLVITDAGDRLDRIGAGMSGGEIRVEGDAGAYAGLGMRGGRLAVEGSAGHGAAVAMIGGELHIRGSVGDELGGALPGEGTGMRDGLVVVGGSAGAHAGDRMRRGLVLVAGDAGAFCGTRLKAGTIVVGGRVGEHAGVAMRRGTMVCLGATPAVPPSFTESGIHELVFARLLIRFLEGTALADHASTLARARRWTGDLAIAGKGEILVPA